MMQRRIVRLYGELKIIESELESRTRGSATADLERRTADLEYRANHLQVPLSFSRWLYTLKQHIRLVRGRLAETSG